MNYSIFKFLIFLLSPIVLLSQNYNDAFILGQQNIDFDARTLSLGNSTLGANGSFSSTLINPAGLATIKRDLFSMSFNSNKFKNSVDFLNSPLDSERNNGNINQVSIILPLPVKRGSAVFAFGYNQVNDFNSIVEFDSYNSGNSSMIQDLTNFNEDLTYELGLSYPVYDSNDDYLGDETLVNGRLNQRGKIISDGYMNSWVFSGAAEIAKNLFLGGTINIISGDYKKNRTYFEEDTQNNYTGFLDPADSNTYNFERFFVNDIVDWDLTGWDLRIGLLYRTDMFLNFGAMIKLPSVYSIEEKYSIYGESDFEQTYFVYDSPGQPFEYEITTPMEIAGGISASFPFITLNLSTKFVDYSQLEFSDGFRENELFQMNEEINEVFESTFNWNFGAEFTLPYPSLKFRGGFIYNPSPYVGDSQEFDKKYITGGIGFPIAKRLLFDFAFVHGWWKDFGDNYGIEQSRTYQDIKLNKLVFSLSYIFM